MGFLSRYSTRRWRAMFSRNEYARNQLRLEEPTLNGHVREGVVHAVDRSHERRRRGTIYGDKRVSTGPSGLIVIDVCLTPPLRTGLLTDGPLDLRTRSHEVGIPNQFEEPSR